MGFIGAMSKIVDEVNSLNTFGGYYNRKSCGDYSNDNAAFCAHFAGQYRDTFFIVALIFLISAGSMIFSFPLSQIYVRTAERAMEEKKAAFLKDSEDKEELLKSNNIGGYSFIEYCILYSINTIIVFVAKVYLFEDDSFYLRKSNRIYKNTGFGQWCNANTILIVAIFTTSIQSSLRILHLITDWESLTKHKSNYLTSVCGLIFIGDVIGSIVMICMKYGYGMFFLYELGISLMVGCILGITMCCWLPIYGFFSVLVVFLFRCLSFGADAKSGFGKVMLIIGGGIVLNIFFYLLFCLILVFVWLCMGGVPQDTVVMDKSYNQTIIALLFLGSAVYSVVVAGIGILRTLCCPPKPFVITNV
jgi:hypothetical protein